MYGKTPAPRPLRRRPLSQQGAFAADLARCRVDLDATRLVVMHAAAELDRRGNKVR